MKRALYFLLAVGLVATLATTGCSRKRTPPITKFGAGQTGSTGATKPGEGPEKGTAIPGPGGTESKNIEAPGLPPHSGLEGMVKDDQIFKANTVYFEFDRSALRQVEQPKAQAVAKVLQERPNTKVQIEGHCDERGTEEYNRSLGERRALAIREFLLNLGIDAQRVFTISYGEDRPAATAHNEEAWAKNRRGEFILYSPKN